MATIQKLEDLDIWQRARILSSRVYPLTYKGLLANDFRLRDQVRGSVGSIMDNIAEGFERAGTFEFINFLTIARASAGELKSQLYRCLDNNYIAAEIFNDLYPLIDELIRKITAFINYLNKSSFRGQKFKNRSSR